jgi:hypothetical protein
MDETARERARLLVVRGFVVIGLGFVLTLVRFFVQVHPLGWLGALQTVTNITNPLIWMAAALAFWWLCQLEVSESRQLEIVGKAYYGFALQSSLLAIMFLAELLFELSDGFVYWWDVASDFISVVGMLMTVIGFVILARGHAEASRFTLAP